MQINTRNRNELKAYFRRNAIPTESQFAELIDGMLNFKEDGLVKQADSPLSVEAVGAIATSEKSVIHFYQNFADTQAEWVFNLNPFSTPNNATTAHQGFNIADRNGTSRLFIDKNTGQVGIGTTTPQAKLHIVNQSQNANGNTLILGDTTLPHLRLGYHNDYSWIQSHGSKPLAINPLGNSVGIGTTETGSHQLIVQQSSSGSGQGIRLVNGNKTLSATFWVGTNAANFDTEGTASLQLRVAGKIALYIDNATSNIGIGTTSPDEQLHVGGRIKTGRLTIGNWPAIPTDYVFVGVNSLDQTNQRNYALLQSTTGITFLNSPATIQFRINNDDKMVLLNDGNLQVNTRVNFGSTTRQMINLWSTIYGIGVQAYTLYFRTDSNFSWFRDGFHNDATFQPGLGGIETMRLDDAGNLNVRGNFGKLSDIELKKNISSLDSALDQILKLRGVTFEWKQPERHGNAIGIQRGLIAQDVEKVFPEWVRPSFEDYKAVNYAGFEALVIEALRELNDKIEQLSVQPAS